MSTLPDPCDDEVESEGSALVGFQPFNPNLCATPSRTAIASLYCLEPGWYRVDVLTGALAAELPITEKWLRNVIHWAWRGGAFRRRRFGSWRLVYVDAKRMRRAWPDFDPAPYLLVPLHVEPIAIRRSA